MKRKYHCSNGPKHIGLPQHLDDTTNLVFNKNISEVKGTLGGIFKSPNGQLYAMTCLHAVKEDTKDWNTFSPAECIEISLDDEVIGTLFADGFYFDESHDFVLIELKEGESWSNKDAITAMAEISTELLGKEVFFWSSKRKERISGFITHINENRKVFFERNRKLHEFKDLILVSSALTDGNPISVSGESGSWIIDASNFQVIGYIVAANFEHTFVIPIKSTMQKLEALNLSLK